MEGHGRKAFCFIAVLVSDGMELIFTLPFSKIVTIALKNSEYPWDVQTSIFLLLCFLNMFLVLFKVKQLFKNTTQRSALRQVGYRWQAAWEDVCRYLSQLSPPMVWEFIPEQVRSSEELTECLEEVCLDPGTLPQSYSMLRFAGAWPVPIK